MKTLHFHTGRGGQFYNPGYTSFHGVKSINDILNYKNVSYIKEKYYDVLQTLENKQLYNLIELLEKCRDNDNYESFERRTGLSLGKDVIVDNNGRHIINSNAETGTLNWDNNYDTDVIMYLHECSESDLMCIYNSNQYDKLELIQEFFDEYSDLKIDWNKFNHDYKELIYAYFNYIEVDINEFYITEEEEEA